MIKLLKSIPAHEDKVWSLSKHPTLPLLATSSTDKTSRIYNTNSWSLVSTLDDTHKRSIRSVSFKPVTSTDVENEEANLPALALGSFDSTISVWGIDDPEDATFNLMAIIEGHENEVKGISWSCGGNMLASCSRDKSIWIWETDEYMEEFECVSVLQDHSQDVKHVVWHPNMDLLASSSYDDTVRLYRNDDDDWSCVAVLDGHEGTVWCSDFEKTVDGSVRLCSGSDDCTVRIWKMVTKQKIHSTGLRSTLNDSTGDDWEQEIVLPRAHTRSIYSVNWSKSGKIASTGSDGLLVIYDEVLTENGGKKWQIIAKKEVVHGVHEVNCVIWGNSGDSEVLFTAGDDGNVNVWKVE